MTRQILDRWSGSVLWEGEAETVKDALHAAIKVRADLTGANLTGADLTGANLTRADLTSIRDDFWAVLSAAPAEVPALIQALKDGRVDGSTYSGECACLVGTIANARQCGYQEIPSLVPNSRRPAEVWFMAIRPTQTPETNQAAKIAVEWAEEWLARMRATFAPAPAPEG